MSEITFSDQNFEEEVLGSDVPVLVDFWAPWCGPCRVQGPIIEELASEMSDGSVKIGKLNVDDNQQTAGSYGILSIPTLVVFKDGKEVEKMTGVHQKDILKEKLEAAK